LLALGVPFLPLSHRRKPHTLPQALLVDLANDYGALAAHVGKLSAIVHLAAAVPHSESYPDNDVSANCTRRMDRRIRDLQQQSGVPVIYMSTCGLYDRSTVSLKNENDHSQVIVTSPYFAAKADGEALFLSDGTSTVLRLAAPVGAGLKPQLVLSRFVATARANGTIKIWGSGTREQDFIDTADIAELILSVLNQPRTTILNAASGVPTTMAKLAETVIAVVGAGSIEIAEQADPRDGEMARYSIIRARDYYGWSPRCGLDESLASLIPEDFEGNV
jgi:nucleoside-diphosphate-sugar epimerase